MGDWHCSSQGPWLLPFYGETVLNCMASKATSEEDHRGSTGVCTPTVEEMCSFFSHTIGKNSSYALKG